MKPLSTAHRIGASGLCTVIHQNHTAMKSILFAIAMLSTTALSGQTLHRAYFILGNWQTWLNGQFHLSIDISNQTFTVTPYSPEFTGITAFAIYDDINCGSLPLCFFRFKPVRTFSRLPSGFAECAAAAKPFFLQIFWVMGRAPGVDKALSVPYRSPPVNPSKY
jgi:hypothetical protein